MWSFSKSIRATLVGILRHRQELGYKLICVSNLFQSINKLLLIFPVLEKLIRQMKTRILEYLGNSQKQKTNFLNLDVN